MKPHKHAPLIKAWADGAKIQYMNSSGHWEDCSNYPCWDPDTEYKLAPEKYVRMYKTLGTSRAPLVAISYDPDTFNIYDLCDFDTWISSWHRFPGNKTPRPYADVIKAWASGEYLETKTPQGSWEFLGCPSVVSWESKNEFRVTKVNWVRLYRLRDGSFDHTVSPVPRDNSNSLPYFREWVGDWKEVSID